MTDNIAHEAEPKRAGGRVVSQPRINAVDALRGFALVGVGLVHAIEQYVAAPHTKEIAEAMVAGFPDQAIGFLSQTLLTGKFYLMFSLLFGLSFFLQIDRPHQRGEPFSGRFAWRLLILIGFGYIHHLFYRGDILMLYGVMGFSLLFLYRVPTRALFFVAIALFIGVGRYISVATFNDSLTLVMPNSPENLAYFEMLKNGSLWDVMATNNFGGLENLVAFHFGVFGRGYTTFGLFLIGMCLGRLGIFADLPSHRPLIKKVLLWTGVFSIVIFGTMVTWFLQLEDPQNMSTWPGAIFLTLYDLFNLSVATIFCSIFLLAVMNGKKMLAVFAPYGRMALTNYLVQGLAGSFIFYGWGLGQLGEWSNRYLICFGIILAAGQILFSRIWMAHYYYGPCEWLWRSLTLRKAVKFRRSPASSSPAVVAE